MCASTRDGVTSASTIEQSAIVSERDRGHDRGRSRDFEGGLESLVGGVAHMVVDRVALINDHVNANIVGEIITRLRSAWRNLIAMNGHS